jgi:8-amino-7-oxononanoate synthase
MAAAYAKELAALKHAGRYRTRRIFDEGIVDLASNDYLGLAENRELFELTCKAFENHQTYGSKASMLVNGYHEIHRDFEEALCKANNFEAGIVVGSGFSANVAMIEALVRKGDTLIMDAHYHASGQMARANMDGRVVMFAHNDAADLEAHLLTCNSGRIIIAVEGIYSMDGDMMDRRIFDLAARYDALLIVDEAHSSGVIGSRLMGVFDYYNITPQEHHIKMGTLGKAYGGFGAYILASHHIVDFLLNRAKPIIYATAPSLFETQKAHLALEYILEHHEHLHVKIASRQEAIKKILALTCKGLIVPITIGDNQRVMQIQQTMHEHGFLVGAIRQPTVAKAIIRLIARLGVDDDVFESGLKRLGDLI